MAEYANPTTPDDDSDETSLFATLKKQVMDDWEQNASWYREAETDFAMYAGGEGQWEQEEIDKLKAQRKPHATFNFIKPSVNAVNGMEVSNRQEVTYLPRTTQTPAQGAGQVPGQSGMGLPVLGMQATPGADDQGPAEMFTAAGQYFDDQCNAEDEVSDAFQDNTICGMGWTERRIGFDDNPQGDMLKDRIDPLEMGWDARSNKRNLADARRLHRVRQVDKRTAEAMFPGYDCGDIDASWARVSRTESPVDRDQAKQYRSDEVKYDDRSSVTLCEITWCDFTSSYTVANMATGEVSKDLDAAALKTLKQRLAGAPLKVVTTKKRTYYQAFLGKDEILDPEREPKKNGGGDGRLKAYDKGTECQSQKAFKFTCMTGTRDRNKRQWVGIVRPMRDPQKWTNVLYSSSLYNMTTSGKGIIAERSAFENPQKAQEDWARGDMIVWAKEGALSGANPKITNKQATPLPAGIESLMQFALTAMRGVSGVNLETLGGVDREQAASLEYQRRQAATTILAPFFDGLRRYRKDDGRLALDLIQKYLSDGRLIRIVGPEYEKYVPLLKDEGVTEFDIIVAESPSSPNQKEASWMMIQQLLPVVGKQLGPKATAALLKASPLPEPVVDDFAEAAQADQADMANQPPPPELMLVQAQIGKVEADIKKTEADTALKTVEVQQRQLETVSQVQTAEIDAKDRADERAHKQWMMSAEQQSRQAEMNGQVSTEFAKSAGADMPAKFDALGKGLEALASAFGEGMAALAKATAQNALTTQELAKMLAAPRMTVVNDPLTGQQMTATSTVATVQ